MTSQNGAAAAASCASSPVPEGPGPFSGDPSGMMEVRVESRGITCAEILHDLDARICELVVGLRVLTRAQAAHALGSSCREAMGRLYQLGFLDRLVTGRTPPGYCPGPELRRKRPMQLGAFTALRFLRLVAAAQFWVCLSGGSWRAEPYLGFQGRWEYRGAVFWVIAPRLWPLEVEWFRENVGFLPEGDRVIVVAGTRQLAEECARVCPPHVEARYTWDKALAPGGPVQLWAAGKRGLEEAEVLPGRGIDNRGPPVLG